MNTIEQLRELLAELGEIDQDKNEDEYSKAQGYLEDAAINALPHLLAVAEAAQDIEMRGEPAMGGGYHRGSIIVTNGQGEKLEVLLRALAKLNKVTP